MLKQSVLHSSMALALSGISFSAQAALTSSSTLSFDAGSPVIIGCNTPYVFTGTSCTLGGIADTAGDITDMSGSYFTLDTSGNGSVETSEKNAISQFAALHFGGTQLSSGQHTGVIDGSESPAIDNAWNFFLNTGMHTNTAAMIDNTGSGSIRSIDMSGWGFNWAGYGPGGPSGGTISLAGTATLVCSTVTCSDTSSYTLDMDAHIPVGFASVPYSLHLEGTINSVPVPAAAWLFGSGLVGLASVARRRREKIS
ncbi:MAG: VPLPA-CTERM sorting domain-containing protein [Gammaproteobacteria bacterium]